MLDNEKFLYVDVCHKDIFSLEVTELIQLSQKLVWAGCIWHVWKIIPLNEYPEAHQVPGNFGTY